MTDYELQLLFGLVPEKDMASKLDVREQHGLTALQMRERGPQVVIPLPYQNWMCPKCDHHHMHEGPGDYYRCGCGWEGDRNKLLRSEI